MENSLDNNLVSSKGSPKKPYERKIKINQTNQKKFIIEGEHEKKEEEKEVNKPQDQLELKKESQDEIKVFPNEENQVYIHYEEGDNIKNIQISNLEEDNQNNIEQEKIIQNDIFQNDENMKDFNIYNQNENYSQIDYNNRQNSNKKNIERYSDKISDNEDENINENENGKLNLNDNKYMYKYKKIKVNENNIETKKIKEGEDFEFQNEEDEKDDDNNFDYQIIENSPGKIIHQSKHETFDEEGNRIVTTKTIKEIKQIKGGFRIKNIENEKERIEIERYNTTNKGSSTNRKYYNNKKTNSTSKIETNKDDRDYFLDKLAKIKSEHDKNIIKKRQIFNSQSPIIIHESDRGGNIYTELSNEFIEPNSFEEELNERNFNYRTNYGKFNNYINNQNIIERKNYPSHHHVRITGINGMREEYFAENDSINNKKEIPSPIGYIATYSSGSEDNEEIGKSYEQFRCYSNYRKNNLKNRIDKNKIKKEGELIKEREVIYQMEDPNDHNNEIRNRNNIKNHNLSISIIKTQIDTSKSDKRDFQSPDRGEGLGSNRFRKVTMAMISSLGPTCEDRKITRKMRSEVGGVVDLGQELNPINNYKIRKFHRIGYNLNKYVDPKTKLEASRIIQYWWRKLKYEKITQIKIIKIQSIIRRYLIRKKVTTTRITYYLFETLENLLNKHFRNDLLKLFKYSNENKAKKKLKNMIKILNDKKKKQKLLKYFFKYKFISDFLKKKINYQTNSTSLQIVNENKKKIDSNNKKDNKDEIKQTEITEEMYIKYIKEKYLNNNKSQHINQLSIDKKKKNPFQIERKAKYEIPRIKKFLKDEQTQDEKNEYKDIGVQNEKEEMLVTKGGRIFYSNNKPITKEMGVGGTPDCNEIEIGENVSYLTKQYNIKTIPKENKVISQDKISIIHSKPTTKEEGIEGGNININEISEKKSLIFPKIKKEMIEAYTEPKPGIIKLDGKNEISIIKPKKEAIESSTQIEPEENKINKLAQISFLYQKPKMNDQGIGTFTIGEGIDKLNINYIKEKKEYKDSVTEPLIQDIAINKNNLSFIKPIKQLVETDTQYRDPHLPTDKNIEINKIVNKKINREFLYLGSAINRWRKIALGEKIKNDIDNKRIEKLKNIFNIKKDFLKKILKEKFKEFIYACKVPQKVIEPSKNEDFNIIVNKPENEKVQLEGFIIERKKKPDLQIDKKEDYNILTATKIYKDEETQKIPDLVDDGVNPDVRKNEISKNELINFINNKKEIIEEGTNPRKVQNEISNIPSINITNIPKKLVDNETQMKIIPNEICKSDEVTLIQYITPIKSIPKEEVLSKIIKKKINQNKLNLLNYFTRWLKITKEIIINDNADKIIKIFKGYLVRKKMKNNENKKNALKKYVDIYEKILKKQMQKKWKEFVHCCSKEPKKLEPNKGEYFSIINNKPENKEESKNDENLKYKKKIPLEIKNLEEIKIFGETKTDLDSRKKVEIIETGTQNDIPKNEINNKQQISFTYSKKEMIDKFSQNEKYEPKITNSELNIINKIEKKDEGQQVGSWANTIKKNESLDILSNKPINQGKQIIQNIIKKTESLEIIKHKEKEIQHIPEENDIKKKDTEIKIKIEEDSSKYNKKKQIISKTNSYSILSSKSKDKINEFTIDQNTVTILKEQKKLIDQGEQYDLSKENKLKEIIIGNNVKIDYTKKMYEILEKIRIKKEFNKFRNNIRKKAQESIIKREILRMALLRWRFVKGYGGDRYGVIYDRNGNEIGRKEGLVNDVSIQNDINQDIINENFRIKVNKVKISKQKPVYIKSNLKKQSKKMINMGTGDDPNNVIHDEMEKIMVISYRRKPKPKNKISSQNYFKISSSEKSLKIPFKTKEYNKIVSGNKLSFINKEHNLLNSQNRRRDLMIQIISKCIIREKYTLNDYFSKWFNKTKKIIENEKKNKIIEKSISKIDFVTGTRKKNFFLKY